MIGPPLRFGFALLLGTVAVSAVAQTLNAPAELKALPPFPAIPENTSLARGAGTTALTPAVQLLMDFKESGIKFALPDLMDVLRDRRHEGWVLAAYPDPKTGQPLIGAGFSIDLPARAHPQRDPLNPHPFLEPSSAELWQAAGLDPERLTPILERYHERSAAWNKKQFRKHIFALEPDIRDQEATLLLRIGAIQAIYNAQAYCRNFDSLTASQQMALSQLVYQMGVNLEEFSQFLALINSSDSSAPADQAVVLQSPEYWSAVQQSLIHSQWARLYRTRAVSVIAMLDPRYQESPTSAERRVGATLRPTVVRRHGRHRPASRQLASNNGPSAGHGKMAKSRAHSKRKTA
jgi:hypothetical protein